MKTARSVALARRRGQCDARFRCSWSPSRLKAPSSEDQVACARRVIQDPSGPQGRMCDPLASRTVREQRGARASEAPGAQSKPTAASAGVHGCVADVKDSGPRGECEVVFRTWWPPPPIPTLSESRKPPGPGLFGFRLSAFGLRLPLITQSCERCRPAVTWTSHTLGVTRSPTDLAQHTRTPLHPAALASVPYGVVWWSRQAVGQQHNNNTPAPYVLEVRRTVASSSSST